MGNTFTIYTGNNHFDIVTTSDLYAFALVGLTSQITFTTNGDWVASAEGTSDSKYNYIFRYQPSGSRTASTFTSPGSWVFTLNSGTIPVDTPVHWVNGTTASYDGDENSSTPFSAVTYNIEYSSTDAGSGGGDVHVVPLYNPENKIYILPTDTKIYKYFDNRDEYQRIVVNCKMWVLDERYVYIVDNLQRKNSKYFEEAKKKIPNYFITDKSKFSNIDTSFIKYISFMVETKDHKETIIFDSETLLPVDLSKFSDEQTDNYTLPLLSNTSNINTDNLGNNNYQYIKYSKIKPYYKNVYNDWKLISKKPDNYYREITINSNKHGLLTFNIVKLESSVNHRNHFNIKFNDPHLFNRFNCCGTLIAINQIETVPSLLHINKDVNKVHINNKNLLTNAQWRLRRSKIIKSERVKRKRILARTGKGELDFYSLARENPEKYYLEWCEKYER